MDLHSGKLIFQATENRGSKHNIPDGRKTDNEDGYGGIRYQVLGIRYQLSVNGQ